MEHVFDSILASTCPKARDGDKSLFVFDLHCNEAWVIARLNEEKTKEAEAYRYDIMFYRLQNNRTSREMYDIVKEYMGVK